MLSSRRVFCSFIIQGLFLPYFHRLLMIFIPLFNYTPIVLHLVIISVLLRLHLNQSMWRKTVFVMKLWMIRLQNSNEIMCTLYTCHLGLTMRLTNHKVVHLELYVTPLTLFHMSHIHFHLKNDITIHMYNVSLNQCIFNIYLNSSEHM